MTCTKRCETRLEKSCLPNCRSEFRLCRQQACSESTSESSKQDRIAHKIDQACDRCGKKRVECNEKCQTMGRDAPKDCPEQCALLHNHCQYSQCEAQKFTRVDVVRPRTDFKGNACTPRFRECFAAKKQCHEVCENQRNNQVCHPKCMTAAELCAEKARKACKIEPEYKKSTCFADEPNCNNRVVRQDNFNTRLQTADCQARFRACRDDACRQRAHESCAFTGVVYNGESDARDYQEMRFAEDREQQSDLVLSEGNVTPILNSHSANTFTSTSVAHALEGELDDEDMTPIQNGRTPLLDAGVKDGFAACHSRFRQCFDTRIVCHKTCDKQPHLVEAEDVTGQCHPKCIREHQSCEVQARRRCGTFEPEYKPQPQNCGACVAVRRSCLRTCQNDINQECPQTCQQKAASCAQKHSCDPTLMRVDHFPTQLVATSACSARFRQCGANVATCHDTCSKATHNVRVTMTLVDDAADKCHRSCATKAQACNDPCVATPEHASSACNACVEKQEQCFTTCGQTEASCVRSCKKVRRACQKQNACQKQYDHPLVSGSQGSRLEQEKNNDLSAEVENKLFRTFVKHQVAFNKDVITQLDQLKTLHDAHSHPAHNNAPNPGTPVDFASTRVLPYGADLPSTAVQSKSKSSTSSTSSSSASSSGVVNFSSSTVQPQRGGSMESHSAETQRQRGTALIEEQSPVAAPSEEEQLDAKNASLLDDLLKDVSTTL